jgi:outer membrane biogenesis lipoprotein LolB
MNISFFSFWSVHSDTLKNATHFQFECFLAATSSQNLVFFGGGWNETTVYDRVDIYNTLNGSWSTATLSQPRDNLAATSVGNLVFFGGGHNSNRSFQCC